MEDAHGMFEQFYLDGLYMCLFGLDHAVLCLFSLVKISCICTSVAWQLGVLFQMLVKSSSVQQPIV